MKAEGVVRNTAEGGAGIVTHAVPCEIARTETAKVTVYVPPGSTNDTLPQTRLQLIRLANRKMRKHFRTKFFEQSKLQRIIKIRLREEGKGRDTVR